MTVSRTGFMKANTIRLHRTQKVKKMKKLSDIYNSGQFFYYSDKFPLKNSEYRL